MKQFFTATILLLSVTVYAQKTPTDTTASKAAPEDTSYWKRSLKIGFNTNQASFSENWKGGGVNSISYLATLSATVDYAKGKTSFNSLLDLQFGAINNKSSGFFKNADRIFFDNKLGHAVAKHWDIYAAVNFLSQFYNGNAVKTKNGADTTYYVSNFLAPGYLTESFGLEYKPADWFYIRFGTGAARQTFVNSNNIDFSQTKNYGVEPGKTMRNEFAFMLQSGLNKDLHKNINLKILYMGLADYQLPASIRQTTDITWFDYISHRVYVTLTAKVTKYISTTLNGVLLYDYNQDPNVQYSQSLSFGVLVTM
jgi:hypothetical protein